MASTFLWYRVNLHNWVARGSWGGDPSVGDVIRFLGILKRWVKTFPLPHTFHLFCRHFVCFVELFRLISNSIWKCDRIMPAGRLYNTLHHLHLHLLLLLLGFIWGLDFFMGWWVGGFEGEGVRFLFSFFFFPFSSSLGEFWNFWNFVY